MSRDPRTSLPDRIIRLVETTSRDWNQWGVSPKRDQARAARNYSTLTPARRISLRSVPGASSR